MATKATSTAREKIGAVSADKAITTINAFFYGDSGAGKTHLAGTADEHPDTRPVLFLDVEGGTTTLRKFKNATAIDVKQVRSISQLVDIYGELEADQGKTWRTVVIDSLSELQRLDMEHIMHKTVQQNPNMDEEVPSPREYGKSLVHIRKIVRAYRDLSVNCIFTSHANSHKDDTTGKVTVIPNLTGRASIEVPGFIDVVGYLYTEIEKGQIERRLLVGHHPKYPRCKDRLGISNGELVLVNPTVATMFNNMQQGANQ